MKTFSALVAVATLVTFICVQENSAVPLTEVQELEEPMSNENAVADLPEISVDSWKMPYLNNRKKLHIKCKVCCGCCGIGICCLKCKF
ncbi:hepcidin-like [Labrus mixtus]|uniref:hepcidin-like n=1 Tax=Labrus mixtus TaxID=508554 RepID=UPI0029BFACAF|nr:hepcidin-like [Labrus mixtus]XP_060907165.1 hepcidin-like [Labrus mixtus]